MSEQVWWYATRAAGLMTWTTATASVVFGLLVSTRAVRARTGPWFLDLHRFLGGVSLVFLAAHLGSLWADTYVEFGVEEIFVPGSSPWKTEAIAWGIVAAYMLFAVQVSSLLRSQIGNKLWRVIHFLSFAAMVAGSYHAWTAGSDVDNPVTWAIGGLGSLLVVALISMRLQRKDPDDPGESGLSDNRAILEEMRKRLEDLPMPESTPQPQISTTPNASLPRRAPVSTDPPGMQVPEVELPTEEPVAFTEDPFASVPVATDAPEIGELADRSLADPFATPDPFTAETGPPPDRRTSEDEGGDLFDGLTGETSSVPEPPPQQMTGNHPDLFASLASPSGSRPTGDPFDSAKAPAAVVPEPAPAMAEVTSMAEAPSVAPTAVIVEGPPPLPTAIDPATGEPDQAAYTVWLKEWLSYAERYGGETPQDPARF